MFRLLFFVISVICIVCDLKTILADKDTGRFVYDGRRGNVAILHSVLTACFFSHVLFLFCVFSRQREMKIAVIENEYGAISIDTALVEENVREVSTVILIVVLIY